MSATPAHVRAPSVAAAMLGIAVAVRIWNAVVYDFRQQHDMQVHIGYLRDLAEGHLPTTYNAPWYYVLTCVLASPVIAACRLLGTSERTLLHAVVGVSGTVLFLAFMAGCLALGREFGFGASGARWYALLVCAFPVVARTFNMARPENLLLTLTPWTLLLILRSAPAAVARTRTGWATQGWQFWTVCAALGLMVAQKIGGLTLAATAPAFLAVGAPGAPPRRYVRSALQIWIAAAAVAGTLIAAQWLVAGTAPFSHDRGADPMFRSAPASFFWHLDPVSVWQHPFRDWHRGSLPEILLIDLYGDYWRAGFDQPGLLQSEGARMARARFGIVASVWFLLLWTGSLAVLQARQVVRPRHASLSLALTAASALPLLASAAYLGAAALRFYAPVDGDIAKWEYIAWVFVFLPIPIVQALSSLDGPPARLARAALLACAAAGCVQSVVPTAF
jgi:hypothetical protein